MSLQQLKERIPAYAKDLKLNLTSLVNAPEGLSGQQLWGSMVAAAMAARNAEVLAALHAEAAEHLDEAALSAAKSAASIMGMNNVYYRALHLASNKEYGSMPAKLRMNVIMNPGAPKVDFELWSLVASVVNGCGSCIDAHEKVLIEKGLDKSAIQHAMRIAAVVHGVATVLDTEHALAAQSASPMN